VVKAYPWTAEVKPTRLRLDVEFEEDLMAGTVYKVIELVGTSTESWEDAAKTAVEAAAKSVRDLRIAEVVEFDLQLGEDGKVASYRAKVKVSFKHELSG
jgi:flavin-binding protein dodecin